MFHCGGRLFLEVIAEAARRVTSRYADALDGGTVRGGWPTLDEVPALAVTSLLDAAAR